MTKKPLPDVDSRRLEKLLPLPRARLGLPLALLTHGMSVPEACACLRRDLDVRRRFVLGYRRRSERDAAPAMWALEGLIAYNLNE